MWRLCCALVVASVTFAQYSEFAVTDDGRLYFVTSLHTGTEGSRPKIYRITGDGLGLFAAAEASDDLFGPGVLSPLVSGDGSVVGYATNYPCTSGSCGLSGLPRTFYTVEAAGVRQLPGNSVQVSRNGRFLFGAVFSPELVRFNVATRWEVGSGGRREYAEGYPASRRQAVTNEGGVLLVTGNGAQARLVLVTAAGEERVIASGEGLAEGLVSPDGARVVYERVGEGLSELVLTDARGGAGTVVARSPERDSFQPSFANDGTLLFLAQGESGWRQPFLARPGEEPAPLTTIASGVTQAIVSGNGELVWLSTGLGQILRVRVADGVADEMVGPTPWARPASMFALPGSVIRIFGRGLTAETECRLEGAKLPLSEVTADGMAVQIPWEYAPAVYNTRTIILRTPGSPFQQTILFYPLEQPTVTFERDATGQTLQAAHQDFRGVATEKDPARPGETIHVFARNMGAVDRAVATGVASPSDPPARVLAPIACYLMPVLAENTLGPAVGLAVPFAGLAGGVIGVYQIDVTIPAEWPEGLAVLSCRNEERGDVNRIAVGAAGR